MLNRDNYLIAEALEEFGFKLLSCHARVEQNVEILYGYKPILVKECLKKNRQDMREIMVSNGLFTRPEFCKIAGDINSIKGF